MNDRTTDKHGNITGIALIAMISLQVVIGFQVFSYQKRQLDRFGTVINSVVINKTWEKRGKQTAGYYIYYKYYFNNKEFTHNDKTEDYDIGDTIKVKIVPDNPDNHEIIKK